MARDIYCKLHLVGTLEAQSPFHVGGYGEEVDSDMPLARNGAGELYVPGTSLAGALRDLVRQLFTEDLVNRLWGFQKGSDGKASCVTVEDSVVEGGDSAIVEIRDHVGIDRGYGSAAEHIKFDRAILPRGTKLPLVLAVDVTTKDEYAPALAMLAALRDLLGQGEFRLGAAKTRGLGRLKLSGDRLTEQQFSGRVGILATLADLARNSLGSEVPQNEIQKAAGGVPCSKRPRVKMTIDWEPIGPLMVKAGYDGIAADMLPLTSRWDGRVHLVLPGSSIKGAFRSQAERIVRTILGANDGACRDLDGKKRFLKAKDVPLVNELFGQPARPGEGYAGQGNDCLPGRGALGIADCYSKLGMSSTQWQSIQEATDDQALSTSLPRTPGLQMSAHAYHVAIDRWLGSAADGMLYSVLEPHVTKWEPLTLEVDLNRIPKDLQSPAVVLLLLVTQELASGRLPLGFATHRGMGAVKVNGFTLKSVDVDDDARLNFAHQFNGIKPLSNLSDDVKRAWRQWVESPLAGNHRLEGVA